MKARIVSGLVVLALAGCYGDHSDLRERIETVKRRPGEPIEPLPTIETPESFEYAALDLREPFEGAVSDRPPEEEVAVAGEGPRPDFNRRREALESFELDSLEMVGTFLNEDALFGLVEDPDGLIHRVRPDNYLGRNHGRVVAVYDDRIDLIELVPDGAGGWREQEAGLALDEES